jgi:hypothetical protein
LKEKLLLMLLNNIYIYIYIYISSNIEAVRALFLRWWSVVECVGGGGVWWSVVECGGGGGVRRRSEEE